MSPIGVLFRTSLYCITAVLLEQIQISGDSHDTTTQKAARSGARCNKDLDLPLELVWAIRPKRLPTVLTKEKVRQVIAQLAGVHRLIVQLLYGSGLRLSTCLMLWNANIPMPTKNGFGSMFSLLRNDHRTRAVI